MSDNGKAASDGLRPSKFQCALASLGLSLLFLVVYNAANWITSLRPNVGTWHYEWERMIPFVPAMIIPYMSIDLFFAAAPFLCSSRRELRLLSGRITLAIAIAGICFLLFPLTLAVERPYVDGAIGIVFNWFRGVDYPYNLCPSLHIALRTILADLYARHTRGLGNWASNIWFSLIGFSTLLTYQHHVVDIVGGFILAAACFYLVREAPLRLPVERNLGIGRLYAMGCALLLTVAIATRPWGLLLIWPAASLGIVAAGYFGLGPGIFGKHRGRLPLSSRFVLGPLLAGQWLSLLYYRRQSRTWDAVTERLWIGRRLSDREAADAVDAGVSSVIDLTGEFSEAAPFLAIDYRHIPVLDLTAPSMDQLDEAVAFIDQRIHEGVVYVHCKIGYSRSAAVAGAYLLAKGLAATVEDAIEHLRNTRASIVIRPEAEAALRRFAHRRRAP
jgi:membrane-associated phospholipid phosphatase